MLNERVEGAGRQDGRAGRLAGPPLWLISRAAGGGSEPLLVDGGRGGDALAVFCHEEEAEMFLGLWAPGDGWRAGEVGAGELASLLRGPSCAGMDGVVLDPLPEGALAGAAGLGPAPTFLGRDRFLDRLARGARGARHG